MDLQLLQKTLRQFAADRHWQPFHTPKNLSMALMVEAAELAEVVVGVGGGGAQLEGGAGGDAEIDDGEGAAGIGGAAVRDDLDIAIHGGGGLGEDAVHFHGGGPSPKAGDVANLVCGKEIRGAFSIL